MKKLIYSVIALALAVTALTGCESVPAPYENPNDKEEVKPDEKTGTGTETDPFNVAAALDHIKALGADVNSAELFVKGKVVSVKEIDSEKYGNATYYISDDGTDKSQLYIYRSLDLGNKKFTAKDAVKVGDEVIVRGIFLNYKGTTIESVPNKSYLYSINGKKEDNSGTTPTAKEEGTGTQADPYNVAAALAKIKELKTDKDTLTFYVKGKVVGNPTIDTEKFGNATYYISDDGTTTNQLYIFRSFDLDNKKFTAKDAIKAGDDVVVTGKFINFKGTTPETAFGKSWLASRKSNGGTTPTPPPASSAFSFDGQTVTVTNSAVTAGTETITVTIVDLGFKDKEEVKTITLSDGTTITFEANGEKNTPKYFNSIKGIRVYNNNGFTINAKKPIAKFVMTCNKYDNVYYVGNKTATIEFTGNKAVYKNYSSDAKGSQLRLQAITITYAQ